MKDTKGANLQQSAINKNNNKSYEMRSELEKKDRQGVLYSYTEHAGVWAWAEV